MTYNHACNRFFIEASFATPPLDGLYLIEIFQNKARDGRIFNNVRVLDGPLGLKNKLKEETEALPKFPIDASKHREKKKERDDISDVSNTDPTYDSDDSSSSEEDLFTIDLSQNIKQVIKLLGKQERYHAKLCNVSKNLAAEMKHVEQQLSRVSIRKM